MVDFTQMLLIWLSGGESICPVTAGTSDPRVLNGRGKHE